MSNTELLQRDTLLRIDAILRQDGYIKTVVGDTIRDNQHSYSRLPLDGKIKFMLDQILLIETKREDTLYKGLSKIIRDKDKLIKELRKEVETLKRRISSFE